MPEAGFYIIQFTSENINEVLNVQKLGPERITAMVPRHYLKALRALYFPDSLS